MWKPIGILQSQSWGNRSGYYRSREEVEEHKKKDPLVVGRRILEEAGLLNQAKVDEMELRVKEMVDDAVQFADKAEYPDVADGAFPVYAEEVRRG